jgi:ribonuclease R
MHPPDEQQLLDDISHASGGAKSLKSLYALYRLKGQERVVLRRTVKRLAAEGKLVRMRGGDKWGIPRSRETVEGVLSGNAKGFAFLAPDDPELPDVFVREEDLHGAMHGDRVEVAFRAGTDRDRPAGEVVAIVERGKTRIVGLFCEGRDGEPDRLLPFDQRLSLRIVIPRRFTGDAEDGLFVEAMLLREARAGKLTDEPISARVVSVLGHPDEPGVDVRVILRSFGLADQHSEAAVLEAERAAARTMTPAEIARRRDLRGLRTVTIDGESARDFDDAISIARRGDGYRLHVHIADVSAHVPEGTALDDEAYARATSVYFPDRAVHMLPEALASGACSLRPDEDRLAMTAVLDFDAAGEVVAAEFADTVIRSDRRMTYTEMKRILVDHDAGLRTRDAEFLEDFELMSQLADRLIARRAARGGLDFDLPVPIVHVDAEGLVTEIVPSERNIAHRIIEEFMIAANEAVARYLTEQDEPAVHRNHEPPPADKVAAFREVAESFGYTMPETDEPRPKHFQDVLKKAAGKREEKCV